MTTKALQLAKECGATFYQDQAIYFGHRQLENFYAKAQAHAARIAELENALEVLRNHVQDEYDRIYISAVLAK